ncbi:hypothetical protein FQR65_LT00372 [Abscondita terminalis]|nr:hypothetical protein FQR65_LT00372 [Abscondita terminalis]
MEIEPEPQTSVPQSRGRTNSKLKVLVRSHAMREETSPPRDPPNASVISPRIKLIPSLNSSPSLTPPPSIPKPVVVLSPSISRGNSPCRSPLHISPTSTLVPSPISRSSPQSVSSHLSENVEAARCHCNHLGEIVEGGYGDVHRECKYVDTQDKLHICEGCILSKTIDEASHRKNLRNDKNMCDCTNQACTKCYKNDRNINNNLSSNINNNVVGSSNTLTVNRATRGKLRQQSSSQGSFEGSSSNSPCLSRDSSSEQYTDTTGVDLEQFIAETLNRNAKDRALMLRIEQELVSLAKDKIKSHYKFPPMSSYQRMLVHRCAAYFGMDHNIESSGKCVVVNKTKCTRIPDIAFKEYVKEDIVFVEEPRRSILKRDSNSIEDYSFKSPDRQFSLENRRSKSFEEREEEYERARRRIFNRDMHEYSSVEEFGWSEIPWSSTDSENSSRFRLLHNEKSAPRLLKVQSVETGSDMPRPCVAKSYSFGGYGGVSVLTRGDSVLSTHSAGPRLLTKQDSGASTVSWRLSPSSSGYKSQSQISESITPSPTSTPNLPADCNRQDSTNSNTSASTNELQTPVAEKDITDPQVVWAVTDIHNVPKGSIIINPQTGQPVKNIDGSIYHYDPSDPPPGFHPNGNTANNSRLLQSPHKSGLPQKFTKDFTVTSPKKQRSRSSPSLNKKCNLTNSATSPSLPFSPPLQHSRSMQMTSSTESVPNLPIQQYHHPSIYGNNFGNMSAPDPSLQVYHQQPYIVYASYGVPVPTQYDGRIEPSIPEVSGGYFITEPGNSIPQPITYQPASPYWQQQPLTLYQNPQTSNPPPPPQPQRFAMPAHAQSGSYISPNYSSSYCQPPLPAPPPLSQNVSQNSQNTELVPVYSQPVQVVYSNQQHTPPNPVIYPSHHNIMYAQTPVYSNVMVPLQNVPYPQNPPTPSGSAVFAGPTIQDQNVPIQPNYNHLANSMNQLNIGQQSSVQNLNLNQNVPLSPHINPQFDMRTIKNCALKGNKFSTPKNFVSCSSQSSTGTSSPATTVMANYCSNPATASYRTPPETPPTQNVAFGYGPNFVPSAVIRQMSNIRASPPVHRNSRSPTPASDISHVDRHRFSLPPTLYQGMPYVFQNDARMMQGRGQPITCRQQAPIRQQSLGNQTGEGLNKNHKNRKSR